MEYEVRTTPYGEHGDMLQEVWWHSDNGVIGLLQSHIIQTQEAQVHAALIALGWTPPGTTP